MRKLLFLLLFVAPALQAQTTSVSATITDAGGQAWAYGSYSFAFKPSPSNPNSQYFFNGVLFNKSQVISGSLNASGAFSGTLVPSNTSITPSGSTWVFQACPASTTSCSVKEFTITGASQNLTASFTPPTIVLDLGSPPPTGASAYTDSEVIGGRPGSIYYNIYFNTLRFCQVTPFPPCSWISVSGSGIVTSFSAGNLSPLFTTSVANSTTAPALSFALSSAAANTVFGNCTAAPTTPSYCAITAAMLPGGSGTVSSVGLGLPPQFSISGSPVTSAGTLTGAWTSEPANTILSGPVAGSIGGIFDGTLGTTGNSTPPSPSATLTPTTAHDWAFFTVQSTGQSAGPTMPAGWTNTQTNGNNGAIFNQVFNTSAAITATATLANSATWASDLFLLRLPVGSPTIVQTAGNSGAFTTVFSGTFPGNTTTGNSILAIVYGVPPSSTPIAGTFSDTQGNLYTQLGISQNGANEYVIAGLTANVTGAVTPTVSFNSTSGVFSSSRLYVAEVSNIAAPNGEPTFIRMVNSQLPESGVTAGSCGSATSSCALAINSKGVVTSQTDTAITSLAGVQTFVDKPQAGNITITNVATTITSQAITMPSSGCPCRVMYSFSVYLSFAGAVDQNNIDVWVSDGSNNFRGVETGQSNAATGAATSAAYTGWSTVTYSNSATVTFTLKGQLPGSTALAQAAVSTGAGPNAGLTLAAFASN